jgi:hypothetical protein|tara:strand:- start:20921 stop:21301 length:381 start_codon:yes stop_codon:yes gene_type:complete
MKNSKVANINIKLKGLFFKWMEITKPFHKLTNQQQGVLALFLYYHYTYKEEITNQKILWKIIFDYDTKMLIKEELGLKDAGFQNIIHQLRKKGVIKNKRVTSAYIPNLEKQAKNFKIIFNFNIVDG